MKQESIKSGKYSWPRAVNMEKGPYYFISYCHRNGVMISHDLSILASYEVPFWYDDGMIPGKDWLERATEAMSHKNCVGVIFFITKTSLHSSPIFQELKLAMRLSAEKENFSIISVHAGGKQISKWISEGAVPSEYQATYSTAFPDGNIAIMRKNAIDSTDHIPLLLEIFHHSGLLKHKYKSVLERSAFVTKPYMNGHMIVAYRGKSSSVIVPHNIHGKKIIAIGPDVFMNDKSIHNVQIEAGIIEVMDSAFSGCINLKTVRLSESLQYIGHECFKGCTHLKSVIIPDSITFLGDYAFYKCSNLTEIDFGKSTIQIGYATFSQCIKLEAIQLSPNTVAIGNYAFGGCAFASLTIPPNVKKLGTDFCVCNPNLTQIHFVSSDIPQELPDEFGTLCPHFSHITVPYQMSDSNVKTLSAYKPIRKRLNPVQNFINNHDGFLWDPIEGATEYRITIDDQHYTVSETFLPFALKKKKYRIAFCAHSEIENIEDSESYFLYATKGPNVSQNVLVGGSFVNGHIVANNSITHIGASAFQNDYSVSNLDFKGGHIGNKAFWGCLNLKSIHLSNETVIGSDSFNRCTKLSEVNWEHIVELADGCFEGCAMLPYIQISKHIRVLPKRAFRRCINAKYIQFDGPTLELQEDCLRGCMSIEDLDLPDSIQKIGPHAISYMSIKRVKLPSDLIVYDATNLQSCSYLNEISIDSNSIYSIIDSALVANRNHLLRFPPAKKITDIIIPESITIIGEGSFQDNSYIESISTQNTKIVKERAFYANASLKQVTLSDKLERIESEAFAHCEHLTRIVLHGSQPIEISPTAFDDNPNLTLVVSEKRARIFQNSKIAHLKIKIEVQNV